MNNCFLTTGSVIAAIFIFGGCIFLHELGHFLAAKLLGLRVDAFSIGYLTVWRKKIHDVEYRIGCLPLGGYCQIPQLNVAAEKPVPDNDHGALPRVKPLARVIIATAGPLFNILGGMLATVVIWIGGMPQDSPRMRSTTVYDIDRNGPEYAAGLRTGDRIVKLNGKDFFYTWGEFVQATQLTVGQVELGVERDGRRFTICYTPRLNPSAPRFFRQEHLACPFFKPEIPIELHPIPGGIAEKAGIRSGDKLVAINGGHIPSRAQYFLALGFSQGEPVRLTLEREGRLLDVSIKPVSIKNTGCDLESYFTGARLEDEGKQLKVTYVNPCGAAAKAGMRPGDIVIAINGEEMTDPALWDESVRLMKDQPCRLTIRRGDKTLTLDVAAMRYVPMTLEVDIASYDHPSPLQLFVRTFRINWMAMRSMTFAVMNKVGLTPRRAYIGPRNLQGPVGVGIFFFDSVRHGRSNWTFFCIAMVSFSLAVFNLLPLPVLDGGHVFLGCVEMATGRIPSDRLVKTLCVIFAVLLIALMIYTTVLDVQRLCFYSAG